MRVLLDTSVLFELQRPQGSAAVRRALDAFPEENLFVSVISIGEITKWVALLKDGTKRRQLQAWVDSIDRDYRDRLLSVDGETCRLWGEITAAAQKAGRVVPAIDGLIAATALRHNLRIMTRNISDFEPTGVPLLNPWDH